MGGDFMNNVVNKNFTTELNALFSERYEKLYACAFRMIGNHPDTEDVLQNTFLKAYKNLHKFKEESSLYTWVYRILINECYRFFEYIKKLPLTRITENLGINEQAFFESIDYTPNFDDAIIMDELREKCLQAFLKCMPKNQRVCFLLKYCLGLSNQEIADVMEISLENAKVTLHRGRKKLKELFEMRCNLIDPQKPCKCHLWIKYMRDHNLELPIGYEQPKADELKKQHFKNLSTLRKIDYLYTVEAKCSKEEFINRLKKVSKIL